MTVLILAGCSDGGGGGEAETFSVGGTVTGLSGTLVLQNDGGDDLTLTADGAFTFTTALADAADYSVTIGSEPGIQRCTVSSGNGAVAGADTTTVTVACSTHLFFAADDGSGTGNELWKSDGTTAGTVFIADVYPTSGLSGNPTGFTTINGTVFFVVDIGTVDNELWKTDGTAPGTMRVKAINVGNDDIDQLVAVNGTLFFRADDGSTGSELWKSDGTLAGTVMVKDIDPVGANGSFPLELTNVNGTLFFSADDGSTGRELWKSDGSKPGTVRVKDIDPVGANSSSPRNLTDVNGTLFFSADDGSTGRELWKSDGSKPGTMRVADINSGGSSFPGNLTNVNGTLFFSANDGLTGNELYTSDGSTVTLLDIKPGVSSFPENLTNVNGTLLFSARDNGSDSELWRSDGGAVGTGTVRVKDIFTGTTGSFPQSLTNVNGTLFFTADLSGTGRELWKSDGDPANAASGGTDLVKDIRGGSLSSSINLLGIHGDLLLFSADDGNNGRELWKSDGTLAGTMMVKDINTSGSGF